MNLGIIAASIATLRPFFTNLESMVQGASYTARSPNASKQPLVSITKASKAGRKLTGISLTPTGTTESTNIDASHVFSEASEERV